MELIIRKQARGQTRGTGLGVSFSLRILNSWHIMILALEKKVGNLTEMWAENVVDFGRQSGP